MSEVGNLRCVGIGTACASGDALDEEGIMDQASCEAWGESVATEKDAELQSATFDPDGDC